MKSKFSKIKQKSTDKICAFFLEWKADPSSHLSDELENETDEESGDVPHGQFRLVKQNEKLNELISDALASSDAMLKSSPSTNRLINKNISSFVKDWEVIISTLIIDHNPVYILYLPVLDCQSKRVRTKVAKRD